MEILTEKNGRDVRRVLANGAYELADDKGIYVPSMKGFIQGTYFHDVNGKDPQVDHNLNPTESLVAMLNVMFVNGTKYATWYLSLFGGNYSPVAGLTAATYPAAASEITSGSEGYTEAARQVWSPVQSGLYVDNLASKAAFTIITASTLVVYGAALTTQSAKGATTGVMGSATKFTNARTFYNTDVFNLAYRVTLASS